MGHSFPAPPPLHAPPRTPHPPVTQKRVAAAPSAACATSFTRASTFSLNPLCSQAVRKPACALTTRPRRFRFGGTASRQALRSVITF